MRLIIAGGRDYKVTLGDKKRLTQVFITGEEKYKVSKVISGGAKGADTGGEQWAKDHGIDLEVYVPNWDMYGKAAGPMRNSEMADNADACVVFTGGRGTKDMYTKAVATKLLVWDWRKPQRPNSPINPQLDL
jgi:hypothetical protein